MIKTLLVASWLVLAACSVGAQVSANQPKPTGCEWNIAFLDNVHHLGGDNGLIIVISRLGDGESRQSLHYRRLHNVRAYLEIEWKRAPKTILLAQGERVRGYGLVEFYIGGHLFDTLLVGRNGDLLVGSCEPDSIRPKSFDANFYPFRDEVKRKSRKGRTYGRRKPNKSFNPTAQQHGFHRRLLQFG